MERNMQVTFASIIATTTVLFCSKSALRRQQTSKRLLRDLPENAVLSVHDPPVSAWLVHADDVAATVRQTANNHSTEPAVLARQVWVYVLPDSDGAALAYGKITISRFEMAARRSAHLAHWRVASLRQVMSFCSNRRAIVSSLLLFLTHTPGLLTM
jgi:hypothetical protein